MNDLSNTDPDNNSLPVTAPVEPIPETQKSEERKYSLIDKLRKNRKVVPAILGVLFLVGAVAAGVVLVQNEQEVREQAATSCTQPGASCLVGTQIVSCCDGSACNSGTNFKCAGTSLPQEPKDPTEPTSPPQEPKDPTTPIGGGTFDTTCDSDSNDKCTNKKVGDICDGTTKCTDGGDADGDNKPTCKCNTGSTGGGTTTPPAPTCSLSPTGSQTAVVGQTKTYTATCTAPAGTSFNTVRVLYRTTSGTNGDTGWVYKTCTGTSTCTYDIKWTTAGDYYVTIDAKTSNNGFCSGNPWCEWEPNPPSNLTCTSTYGALNCGTSDTATVKVTTPVAAPTCSLSPTGSQTATVGETKKYTATCIAPSGTTFTSLRVLYRKTSLSGTENGSEGWLYKTCTGTNTCAYDIKWTTAGDYYVTVDAKTSNGGFCSGNPWCEWEPNPPNTLTCSTTYGAANCGTSETVTVKVGATTATPTPTSAPTAGKASLTLKFRMQGITSAKTNHPVSIRLRQAGVLKHDFSGIQLSSGSTGIWTASLTTDKNGNTIDPGTYSVLIKDGSHLQKKFINISLVAGSNTKDFSTSDEDELLAGDVTGDNKITVDDTGKVSANYDTFKTPVTDANKTSDINLDGFITIQDVALAELNWTKLVVEGDI
jgi:hypothetical protein